MFPTDTMAQGHAGADYGFAFLDEDAKRELRRTIFKAVCIPGHQVPYASREMPIARGFGTGGMQLTLALLGPRDCVKVIDQGADDSVNAANIRAFFALTCPGVSGTTLTEAASVIQTRHRIPEQPLRDDQILVFQVPYPDPLVLVEPNAATRRRMHGRADYARLWVKLYEDMVAFDEITISHRYPTRINGHYIIDPSPIPRYDVPKLHQAECLYLFGAGREKRIYAVPPHTDAIPITFGDVPFKVEDFTDRTTGKRHCCRRCGANDSFLDEFLDEGGNRVFQCSDAAYCDSRLTAREAAE
ncbi:alpha-D-ribose 1-methylphosphonate 5-phosphate C-P lyase [Roseovarius sp. MBR-79]|jgi:alpha-D-ribose 1-methylphosphonate 5-phosphate C-P lyase